MNFNISKILNYLYINTKNYFICSNTTGTPQEQYDSFEWNSQEDIPLTKPTLQYLEEQYLVYIKITLCNQIDELVIEKINQATLGYDNDLFKTDTNSRLFMICASIGDDKVRNFYNYNGNAHQLTKSQAIELTNLSADCLEAYYANAKILKDIINNSADPESENLDQGWPLNPFTN